MLAPWKKNYDKFKWHIKKQRHFFTNRGLFSQSYDFSSSHVCVWELDHKKGWAPKIWWFWTVVLEKTLESPLGYKEIKPVNPKGNKPWIFIERTDAEAPVLWPPGRKNWLIGKDLVSGKEEGDAEGRRKMWQQKLKWLDGITDLMDMSLSKPGSWWWSGRPGMLQPMRSQSLTWLSNWTDWLMLCFSLFNVFIIIKLLCCWERLKAGGEGDNRGWDGWRASPIQWTWAWISSGWWTGWTGKPAVLQSMGVTKSQTRLNWTE